MQKRVDRNNGNVQMWKMISAVVTSPRCAGGHSDPVEHIGYGEILMVRTPRPHLSEEGSTTFTKVAANFCFVYFSEGDG